MFVQLNLIKKLIEEIEQLDAEFVKTATERPSDVDALLVIVRRRTAAMAGIRTIAGLNEE